MTPFFRSIHDVIKRQTTQSIISLENNCAAPQLHVHDDYGHRTTSINKNIKTKKCVFQMQFLNETERIYNAFRPIFFFEKNQHFAQLHVFVILMDINSLKAVEQIS